MCIRGQKNHSQCGCRPLTQRFAAGGRRVWIMFCGADPLGWGRASSACRSQTVPAPTRPEALRLSGGYVGAKRVIWQMAHNANSVAKERGLDVHFQVLLPLQLVGDTGLGRTVATAYAERDGTTVEDHLVKRYGMPFLPKQYGQEVAEELLTSNAAKPIREQLTLIRMFEQLRERGYEGGYDAVRLPGDGPSSS